MMRSRFIKAVVVPLMLAAALLAQGLRLCLHAPHAADEGRTHAVAVHLESNLTSPADSDDGVNDGHVALAFAFFKKLADSSAAAVLLAAVSVPFLPPRQRFAVARGSPPMRSGDHRLRPPLRAPPL